MTASIIQILVEKKYFGSIVSRFCFLQNSIFFPKKSHNFRYVIVNLFQRIWLCDQQKRTIMQNVSQIIKLNQLIQWIFQMFEQYFCTKIKQSFSLSDSYFNFLTGADLQFFKQKLGQTSTRRFRNSLGHQSKARNQKFMGLH